MKKYILILIATMGISFYLFAQSAGDYRSVGNGNWNDATTWEMFNGGNWVIASTYPGQNAATGTVTIMHDTEITITATVPNPIANLSVSADYPESIINYDCEVPFILPSGVLIFSGENAISLTVSGDVDIIGLLKLSNENGAKTHTLSIGGNLIVGEDIYVANCDTYLNLGDLQTLNLDDKLGVTFNTTDANSFIFGLNEISFHDVTFNGAGITLNNHIDINGHASFINGIVTSYQFHYYISFNDNATVSGASNASYTEGPVFKYGDDPFTFPIGEDGVYAPLTITAPNAQVYLWAYYDRNRDPSQFVITDPELNSVSNCELWVLGNEGNRPINYPLDVTVGWTSSDRCGSSSFITDASNVTMAIMKGNSWDSHTGTGIGTPSVGSVTWKGVTNLHLITLGNVGTSCEMPSGLTTANITANSATASWPAVAGAQSYDVAYRSLGAFSWINAATATVSTSVNLTGLTTAAVYEWKVRANCSSGSSSYRGTQFTATPPQLCNDVYETNNTSGQAKAISIGSTISAAISASPDVDWFKITTPNNNNTSLEITLSNLPADYDLYVYDKRLKLVSASTVAGTSNEIVTFNSNARNNSYLIKVVGKNGAYNTSQCYNLLAQLSDAASTLGKSNPANEIIDLSEKQLLYPNPASEFVHLRFNSTMEGSVNVQIFNTAGQLIKIAAIKVDKGYNELKIAVNDINQGMYLLRIHTSELNVTKKFVVAR